MKTEFLVEQAMGVAPRVVTSAVNLPRMRGARLTNDSAPGIQVSLVELTLGVAPRVVTSVAFHTRKRGALMGAAPEISVDEDRIPRRASHGGSYERCY